jgi:hypothetical protein
MSKSSRKAMIAPSHPGLSLSRQCQILSISRSMAVDKWRVICGEKALALAVIGFVG